MNHAAGTNALELMSINLSLPNVFATTDPAVEIRPVYVEEAVDLFAYAVTTHPPLTNS